jgi:hypothetical protein
MNRSIAAASVAAVQTGHSALGDRVPVLAPGVAVARQVRVMPISA